MTNEFSTFIEDIIRVKKIFMPFIDELCDHNSYPTTQKVIDTFQRYTSIVSSGSMCMGHTVTIWGTDNLDFVKNRNDDLIEAIAASENEEIIAYFSDEFPVQDRWKRENSLMFPFLNDVIKIMLDNNNNKCAEFIIRKMIAHNKSTYEKTYSLIKEACQAEYSLIQKNKEKIIKEAYQNGVSLEELHVKFKTEEDVKRDVICCFKYDNANNVVTFFYGKDIGIATNIFFVNSRNGSPAIKKLIEELNEWYNRVISLGGEKYAEILL